MSRLNKKGVVALMLFIMLLLCTAGAIILSVGNVNTIKVGAESTSDIFTFTTLNQTECDVRLNDKTAVQAIIPETAVIQGKEFKVVSIATNGFSSAKSLKKVRMPHSIKSIGQNAFLNCTALSSITLPAVETIGANAFGMTNLGHIIIPKTVTTVGATILRSNSTIIPVNYADKAHRPKKGEFMSNYNKRRIKCQKKELGLCWFHVC